MLSQTFRGRTVHKEPHFTATIFLALVMLAGCASQNETPSNESANQPAFSSQEIERERSQLRTWLTGLHENMSFADATKDITPYHRSSLQYLMGGTTYEYFEGQFPVTGTLYGLLFENRRLKSLLLNQAVADFYMCRYRLSVDWIWERFPTIISWIKAQNQLEADHSDVFKTFVVKRESSSSSNSTEVVTHLPLAVIGLPVYLLTKPFISEQSDDLDRQSEAKELQRKREALSHIELGKTTGDELIRLLGKPDGNPNDSRDWRYQALNLLFGVSGNVVLWCRSGTNTLVKPTNMRYRGRSSIRCE